MPKKSRNMRTRAFGPPMWFSLFMVAMGYPDKPTDTDRANYRKHIVSIGNVMPCNICRDSFKSFIAEDVPLTDDVFDSRRNLVYFLMRLKNRVNRKLGEPELTKREFKEQYMYYDSFRAKSCKKTAVGCTKATKTNSKPMRVKIVSFVDDNART
jgi:hypothetical protein